VCAEPRRVSAGEAPPAERAGAGAPFGHPRAKVRHVRQQRLLTWLLSLLTVLAGAAVLWLLWRVLRALGPLVTVTAVGVLLAVLLHPLADRVQRAVRSRALSALAVVLLVLAPFVVFAAWLATTVAGEAQGLLSRLPAQLAYASALLAEWQHGLSRLGVKVDLVGELSQASGSVLRHAITILSGAATVTADTVLALIVAFFLIWDGPAVVRSIQNVLPRTWRPVVTDVGRILAAAVAGYVRGQVVVAALFGLLIGASMAALGLPDPVLLGFLAGLFELLPTVGPFLAAAGPVGLALAQPFPHVLWVLLVFVAAQQLESNVLVPRISGGAVGLHPLTVILAVFGGWRLGGLAGAFLAVPVVAVGRDLRRRWWQPATPPPPTPHPPDRPRPVPYPPSLRPRRRPPARGRAAARRARRRGLPRPPPGPAGGSPEGRGLAGSASGLRRRATTPRSLRAPRRDRPGRCLGRLRPGPAAGSR
jgi:predicted PurR-regulated permease PerM